MTTEIVSIPDAAALAEFCRRQGEGLFHCAEADYHALETISYSGLKKILDHSPRAYMLAKETPMRPTPALRFGSLFHKALEHVADWRQVIREEPVVNRRTKAGKEDLARWRSDQPPGVMIATRGEIDILAQMIENLKAKAFYETLVLGSHAEVSGRFFDFEVGVPVKFRIDALKDHGETWALVDFKTTSQPLELGAFRRTAKKYHYNMQAALYTDGFLEAARATKPAIFYVLAFETVAPFDCAAFAMGEEFLGAGRSDYKRGLDIFRKCRETGIWSGQPEEIQIL
jgi:hypothetical protein